MRLLTIGALYPPHHLGGYEIVWRAAVDAMRRDGHDVRVLATDTTFGAASSVEGEAHVDRSLRWFWKDAAFPDVGRIAAARVARHDGDVVRRAIAEHRPEAVTVWAMGGLPLGLLGLPAEAGIPCGAVVHDGWPVYGPQVDRSFGRRGTGLPAGAPFAAVDAWSFNSEWLRDRVLERVGAIEPEDCVVDHPGIDVAVFAATAPRSTWSWRLACVGRIDERKGLAVAIDALAQLPAEATLTITGGGDDRHRAELESQITRLDLDGRVVFAGKVDDIARAYGDADAVLFPVTWDEPFGLVPLEAMAAGRPVVATGTGGSAEFLRDGENTLLAAPGDATALADRVRALAADAALRERLIDAGRRTAERFAAAEFDSAMASFATRLSAG